jgi:D-glycero-D-manno-heptose 1,7-bisphosphate phosphatase
LRASASPIADATRRSLPGALIRARSIVERMGKKSAREHLFVETDGQVYLVRDRGRLRFPRSGEALPFPTDPNGVMDFGEDRVMKRTPRLDHHPEEWIGRDAVFERSDVDPLVKRAIYTTMIRCVSEVVLSNGSRVLMVKAVRGFSKGHWNIPGGFMDYGEGPEAGVEREAREEIGVGVLLDGLLNVYVSGFPGKPAYTLGFVYRGHLKSQRFRLKADEIEDATWFTVDKGLTLTRNPFAKWGLVDWFLQSSEARRALRVKRHGLSRSLKPTDQPTVFLDRDGVINRGRPGYVRTPAQFEFLPRAIAGLRLLQDHGWRLVIVTNQDASGWKLVPERQLARIHDRMLAALRKEGVKIAEIYFCPHHVLSDCACRKPRPGMLLAAARDLGVRPRSAWMVGDKVLDVQTGRAFGCRTAWVGPPAWRKRFAEEMRAWSPDVVADDVRKAAAAIVSGPT